MSLASSINITTYKYKKHFSKLHLVITNLNIFNLCIPEQIPYWASCMNYPYMMMPSYHTSATPSLGFPQMGLGFGSVTNPQAGLQAVPLAQGLPCAPVSMPVLSGGDDFYLTGGGETEEIPSGLMDYTWLVEDSIESQNYWYERKGEFQEAVAKKENRS
ncbi:unnamed protein product [Dibothriocephalus latus]|uniref:Uncharacterized protein n=1 Tax=Dibothriocephalus latus TaxID=60516 RepID=A0A3P6T2J9_DIBLA|nr:unnamed protein product [Dibothriocephalus latus]